jgi:hypothetical protein
MLFGTRCICARALAEKKPSHWQDAEILLGQLRICSRLRFIGCHPGPKPGYAATSPPPVAEEARFHWSSVPTGEDLKFLRGCGQRLDVFTSPPQHLDILRDSWPSPTLSNSFEERLMLSHPSSLILLRSSSRVRGTSSRMWLDCGTGLSHHNINISGM